MSVINQMLKDLEQRAPEQGQAPMPVAAAHKPSSLKIVLISVVVLLSLNALGFYIWNLQERVAKSEVAQQAVVNAQNVAQVLPSQATKTAQQGVTNTDNENQNSLQQLSNEPTIKPLLKPKPIPVRQQQQKKSVELAQVKKVTEPSTKQPTKQLPEPIKREPLLLKKAKPSQMSISRRQLTSKELVAKKLARAEKSVNINEIAKAEQLFEDILIIEPAHKQARKKLAALWFGRKSYQQALNLLSQGLAIDTQDDELRLMKAQIHLKLGQHEAAFDSLKPLASLEQEEYQVMLATIAQQIEQYPSAISAYQMLIKMQPYSGRWHLGLAIVYDKSSQFLLAVNEYELALTKTDLSASSVKFAEQRMQALGE